MTRAWTRTTADGDTVTVTVDAEGAAVSVLRITGAREGWVLSLDDFEAEWLPFLGADFDDATDDVADALTEARGEAVDRDDREP